MKSYGRLCTQFYDLDKLEAPVNALEFYLDCAAGATGPILEPMCGSGRFLIPILMRGFEIDGVDASPHMLEACRRRCAERALAPVLYEQDIEQMALPRQYALVILPASSFCLLTDPVRIHESLERILDHMLPGARFVVEVELHSDRIPGQGPGSPQRKERTVERPDGARIVLSSVSSYDRDERIMRTVNRYELVKDGKLLETEMEELDVRHYDIDEFTRLLGFAGFRELRALKPCSLNPADGNDGAMRPLRGTAILECRRPQSL